jgi:predicted TPR repeat methyltransferase
VTGPVRPPDFEAMYQVDADPWRVESSWYERRKLQVLLAALPRPRYRRGWEPGCGIGVTTDALARRTDELVAGDPSSAAVTRTRERTERQPHVRVDRASLPDVPEPARFHLVVLAEFLYYLDDLSRALEAVWSACAPEAHVAFLHWVHHPHDAFCSGSQVHAATELDAVRRRATKVVSHQDRHFLLDVYETPR